MSFLEDFWEERFKDNPKGYKEHLEAQKKWREQFENKDRIERKTVSNLFMEPTREDMKDFISDLSEKELLNVYYHLERAKKEVEIRYYERLEKDVFSVSHTTFKDIVERNCWEDVAKTLLELFPDQEKSILGYQTVYEELQSLSPEENKEGLVVAMRLVEEEDDEGNDASYYDVAGLKKNDLQSYALDFTPWQEWLGFTCDERSLQTQGELAFIAHCLWEMTFDGFEQEQIQENLEEMKRRVEEVKKREEEDR